MALFQNSVINKYLRNLDRQTINAAYARFDKFFHNPVRQENIQEKYYQPLHSILNGRDTANNELAWYLKEPGYE